MSKEITEQETKFQQAIVDISEAREGSSIWVEIFQKSEDVKKTKLLSDGRLAIFFNPSITGAPTGKYYYNLSSKKFEKSLEVSAFPTIRNLYKETMSGEGYKESHFDMKGKNRVTIENSYVMLCSEDSRKIYVAEMYIDILESLGVESFEIKDANTPIRFTGEGISGILATVKISS